MSERRAIAWVGTVTHVDAHGTSTSQLVAVLNDGDTYRLVRMARNVSELLEELPEKFRGLGAIAAAAMVTTVGVAYVLEWEKIATLPGLELE